MAVRRRQRPWKVGFVLLVLAAVAGWVVLSMGWQDRLKAVVTEGAADLAQVEQPALGVSTSIPESPAPTVVSARLASTATSTTVPIPILSATQATGSPGTRGLSPSLTTAPIPTVMPAAAPAPTPRPTVTPVPEPVLPPHLRHMAEKQHALDLINGERMKIGIELLSLGSNNAAQLHAESSLSNCVSGHWGGRRPQAIHALFPGRRVPGQRREWARPGLLREAWGRVHGHWQYQARDR